MALGQQAASQYKCTWERLIPSVAVSMVLSGLCGTSVRQCQISTLQTVALCPAHGCSSMGPLMHHSGLFIVHLGTEHRRRVGVGGVMCHITPGRYASPRAQDKTKATLWSIYWTLISSPPSFHINYRRNRKEQEEQRQHSSHKSKAVSEHCYFN